MTDAQSMRIFLGGGAVGFLIGFLAAQALRALLHANRLWERKFTKS